MAAINTGSVNPIADGQIVQYTHVLPIVRALSGQDPADITITGNVVFNGSGVSFDTSAIPMTGSNARFTTITATTVTGSSISGTSVTGSVITASTNLMSPTITGSNIRISTAATFGSTGSILNLSSSIPLVTHTISQSVSTGNQITFGGSQFKDYIFAGNTTPRIGIGASSAISYSMMASGSFIQNLPGFTPTPATILITSSDAYVMKIATTANTQSFAVSSSGFVGINTWTPREALDVQLGNAAIKNPTTTSGSILYVENNSGRILDITNQITNSIFTVQTISGLPIFDTGTNSAAASYVAVTGNGSGVSSRISSSLALISGTLALPFTTGSTVSVGATDVLIVATSTVTLPTATAAGVGRYYRIRNAHASTDITIGCTSPSTMNGVTVLGPTSASGYVSDGIGIWYSI